MMFIHLIIILINSLSMLIIIVEHLFVWFIHVLGGGKATLLLLQHVMHIASFILHWKLCHVPKGHDRTGTTSWMQLHTLLDIQAEDMLHLHLMYYWKRYVIIVSIGSLFIFLVIQKCSSILNHCLIELVV
jgi:hypothetical protein